MMVVDEGYDEPHCEVCGKQYEFIIDLDSYWVCPDCIANAYKLCAEEKIRRALNRF